MIIGVFHPGVVHAAAGVKDMDATYNAVTFISTLTDPDGMYAYQIAGNRVKLSGCPSPVATNARAPGFTLIGWDCLSPNEICSFYIDTFGVVNPQGCVFNNVCFVPPLEANVFEGSSLASCVGGDTVPVDKLALLTPFIGLASLIVAATAVTALYVRRAKHREEKQ
jgi:hypothetical protein